MYQLALVEQYVELPAQRDGLREHRGRRRPAYAPAEDEYEYRREYGIDHHREDGRQHRLPRMAAGAQHGVQAQIAVRDDVAREYHLHEVLGIAVRLGARAKHHQDLVQERIHDEHESHPHDDVEHDDVAQHLLCRVIVLLPQLHRDERRRADTHQRAECRREVHQRERECQPRDGERPHAVAYEDAVNHVVERRRRHRDDCRDGVLNQKFPNGFFPKDGRCILFHIYLSFCFRPPPRPPPRWS